MKNFGVYFIILCYCNKRSSLFIFLGQDTMKHNMCKILKINCFKLKSFSVSLINVTLSVTLYATRRLTLLLIYRAVSHERGYCVSSTEVKGYARSVVSSLLSREGGSCSIIVPAGSWQYNAYPFIILFIILLNFFPIEFQ